MYIICIRMINAWISNDYETFKSDIYIFSIPLPRLELQLFSQFHPSYWAPTWGALLACQCLWIHPCLLKVPSHDPSPEVQVVQVVVAAEGNLVQRWQSRLDLDVFFVKSLYIPTQDTQNTTSVKILLWFMCGDIYSIVVISDQWIYWEICLVAYLQW